MKDSFFPLLPCYSHGKIIYSLSKDIIGRYIITFSLANASRAAVQVIKATSHTHSYDVSSGSLWGAVLNRRTMCIYLILIIESLIYLSFISRMVITIAVPAHVSAWCVVRGCRRAYPGAVRSGRGGAAVTSPRALCTARLRGRTRGPRSLSRRSGGT